MENQVKFKIGQIEFEAKGSEDVIERERNIFLNTILPVAVDALQHTQEIKGDTQYIETTQKNEKVFEIEQEVSEVNNDILKKDNLSRVSLASFLTSYGNLNDKDFILVASYYYEKKNNTTIFSVDEVKQYYVEARRKEYSNPSVLLAQLAKNGYIMDNPNAEKKSPKQYILTSNGLAYVEAYQPKETDGEKKKVQKARKPRVKTDSAYSVLDLDELNLSQYPEIKKFDKFKDQMIMIMYIVTSEGKGELFNSQDIEYIMVDVLGLPATNNQIGGIINRNKQWFKKEKEGNNTKMVRYKLLEGGKDYARKLIEEYKQ